MKPTSKITEGLWWLASFAVTAGFVYLWQVAADAKVLPPAYFPGPDRAWAALVRWAQSGSMLEACLLTFRRMVLGWVIASIFGIILGCVIASSSLIRTLINPILEFLRPLPATALMPIAILFFGLSEQMVLATIAFGAIWPVLLATIYGVTSTEPRLFEVAQMLQLSRLQTIYKIVLPGAMPPILSSLRLTLTIALILTVIGERLASRPGLGQFIFDAAHSFRAADVFAGTMVLACVGLAINLALQAIEQRILRWR